MLGSRTDLPLLLCLLQSQNIGSACPNASMAWPFHNGSIVSSWRKLLCSSEGTDHWQTVWPQLFWKGPRQQELLSIPPLITHRYLPDFRLIYFRLIACVSANAPSGHKRPKYWVPPWQPHGLSGKLKIEGWYGGDTEEGQGYLKKKKIAREHERLGYLFEAWVSFWVLSSKTQQVSLTGIAAAWRAQPQPRIFTIDGFLFTLFRYFVNDISAIFLA